MQLVPVCAMVPCYGEDESRTAGVVMSMDVVTRYQKLVAAEKERSQELARLRGIEESEKKALAEAVGHLKELGFKNLDEARVRSEELEELIRKKLAEAESVLAS